MKNLTLFPTIQKYEEYIRGSLITQKEFTSHKFYNGLINFIIDHKTPIFFSASEEYEYSHFTQYFNFNLVRDHYTNPYIKSLYWIHDFVHMIFYNPLRPRNYSLSEFARLAITNEYVASNETGILTYYRLPKIRQYTFDHPILFDFLSKYSTDKPPIFDLYKLRQNLIEDSFLETFFLKNSEEKNVIKFHKKFQQNNTLWTQLWHQNFPDLADEDIQTNPPIPTFDYDLFLENYTPIKSQKLFEKNINQNIHRAFSMLNMSSAPLDPYLLEGKILMQQSAYTFHQKYKSA